ncbi:MAG: phosphoglycerate dehydrogenase [Bacillota bacterium]|uniref:phosphoglycerate dehydrogenase n=1 Tax=Desulfurispora thermophila TaxID=265470 RepID=UPI000361C6A3|nr:phosphoglycerate dehydrogenase [Desulfurispora thermophila]
MYKVLVMDNVAEEGLAPLRQNPEIEVVIGGKMTEDELCAAIGEYDAMIVRSATKVTARVVENAARLKIVGRAGVGVDNIDLAACTAKGILVVNAPDGNTIAATEHTIAMMLALARNIPQAAGKMREGIWDKKAFLGVELRGKTLGILGLGRIGSAVAKRAQAMEMEVVAYDPFITEEKAATLAVRLLPLEEVLQKADFLTIHMPKTKESYHLINDDTIALMKDGVRIINCARGGIIDEAALYRAMQSGKVAGAALDVFEKEPNTDSPLLALPNFIATPHLGASTCEAQLNVAVDVAEEIVAALTGGLVKNTVNIPSISPKALAAVRPYLGLAEKMGRMLAQLVDGRLKKIEVVYSGDVAKCEVAPITTALVKGVLDPILQEVVNFVNASFLAKNRGIQVFQACDGEGEGYSSLITVRLYTDKGENSLAGTLTGQNEERIVMIDGYRVDLVPARHMLYVPHQDKPRIIGPVGTLIGEHSINIAAMQVGRKEIGGKAVMLLSVDCPVPPETLKAIAAIDGVFSVKMINL